MNTMLKRDSMPGERLRSQNPTESSMSNRQNQFNNCRVLCSLTNVRLSIAQIAHLLQGALKLGPLDSKNIGGGSYWAGWAAARPLFGFRGPQLCLARPLLAA